MLAVGADCGRQRFYGRLSRRLGLITADDKHIMSVRFTVKADIAVKISNVINAPAAQSQRKQIAADKFVVGVEVCCKV